MNLFATHPLMLLLIGKYTFMMFPSKSGTMKTELYNV